MGQCNPISSFLRPSHPDIPGNVDSHVCEDLQVPGRLWTWWPAFTPGLVNGCFELQCAQTQPLTRKAWVISIQGTYPQWGWANSEWISEALHQPQALAEALIEPSWLHPTRLPVFWPCLLNSQALGKQSRVRHGFCQDPSPRLTLHSNPLTYI